MAVKNYQYVIAGGGLAGVSAIEGIREIDKSGSILLIGIEKDMPYDRPPLSKKLWFGKKKVEEIFLHDQDFYKSSHVDLALGTTVTEVRTKKKLVLLDNGDEIEYKKLLLATGGMPRKLEIQGGNLPEISYYRTLEDYKNIRSLAEPGKKAVVIGGGFIGSEISAALNISKIEVTMIFPEDYLVQRIFPDGLGNAVQKVYLERGIRVLHKDIPVSIEKTGTQFVTKTRNGQEIKSDIVIAGIGIIPETGLAGKAGLKIDNGIVVDEYLRSSDQDIFSAGDNTNFVSIALGKRMRLEHWDNSIQQGKSAGRNMAGANVKFDYIPYFFSDLFEFGYEAAGDIDSRHQTYADWKKENDTGVIYYLNDERVKGIMLCNVWDKIDIARDLIRKQKKIKLEELKGAIPF